MANLFEILLQPVFNTEETLVGGTVDFYDPGTTGESNRKDVYSDEAGTIVAANPYTLSANATAALYGTGKYHIVIKDNQGVIKYDYDYYSSSADVDVAIADATTDAPHLDVIVGDELINVTDNGVLKNLTLDELAAWIAAQSGASGVGSMLIWPTVNAPTGYLKCDGTEYAIATYPQLGALLGSTFGGNGTSTFAVPDFKGRSPIGLGQGDAAYATTWALGEKGGTEEHPLTTPELASHNHTFTAQQAIGGYTDNGGAPDERAVAAASVTQDAGSGEPHNNLSPVMGINIVIKH